MWCFLIKFEQKSQISIDSNFFAIKYFFDRSKLEKKYEFSLEDRIFSVFLEGNCILVLISLRRAARDTVSWLNLLATSHRSWPFRSKQCALVEAQPGGPGGL